MALSRSVLCKGVPGNSRLGRLYSHYHQIIGKTSQALSTPPASLLLLLPISSAIWTYLNLFATFTQTDIATTLHCLFLSVSCTIRHLFVALIVRTSIVWPIFRTGSSAKVYLIQAIFLYIFYGHSMRHTGLWTWTHLETLSGRVRPALPAPSGCPSPSCLCARQMSFFASGYVHFMASLDEYVFD